MSRCEEPPGDLIGMSHGDSSLSNSHDHSGLSEGQSHSNHNMTNLKKKKPNLFPVETVILVIICAVKMISEVIEMFILHCNFCNLSLMYA